MNIIEIKTFKFEELTDKAQQNAIEQYRDSDHLDHEWYDFLECGKQYY